MIGEKAGQIERIFTWGRVEFSSKDSITVTTPEYKIVFSYFKGQKGRYYKSWRPFRQEIKRRNLKSLYDIHRYAERYDIDYYVKETSIGKRYKNIMEREI